MSGLASVLILCFGEGVERGQNGRRELGESRHHRNQPFQAYALRFTRES